MSNKIQPRFTTPILRLGAGGALALFPATPVILAASVAYGRWLAVPYQGKTL